MRSAHLYNPVPLSSPSVFKHFWANSNNHFQYRSIHMLGSYKPSDSDLLVNRSCCICTVYLDHFQICIQVHFSWPLSDWLINSNHCIFQGLLQTLVFRSNFWSQPPISRMRLIGLHSQSTSTFEVNNLLWTRPRYMSRIVHRFRVSQRPIFKTSAAHA